MRNEVGEAEATAAKHSMFPPMRGRVLVVAGSDSGGGAGIQADIKTITALGGYAMTAITALTAQNTEGVHGIHAVPPSFIEQQIDVVLEDLGADALKTGMLHDAAVIGAVASRISRWKIPVVVVDPVMVAKGGASLLAHDATTALTTQLLPLSTVVTPNAPEATALTGVAIASESDLERAGRSLIALGARAALVKGGHVEGDEVTDVLVTTAGARTFRHPRLATRHTHGTGCTLASAIATGLAQGASLEQSVSDAIEYVVGAMKAAPGFGRGHGPLNHAWKIPHC
jgi:hydroxymethylpyrimidine/phosphomethylpyrimidine kinase